MMSLLINHLQRTRSIEAMIDSIAIVCHRPFESCARNADFKRQTSHVDSDRSDYEYEPKDE